MTRQECEKWLDCLLSDIRDTVKEYNPDIKQVNLSIVDDYNFAFSFIGEEKVLDLTVRHEEVEDDAEAVAS